MKTVIVAIDIETRGPGPMTNGIISIGVCVGSSNRCEILEKKRFDLEPLPNQKMDKNTWEDFWSKHQEQLDEISSSSKNTMKQMIEFRQLLDKWGEEYDLFIAGVQEHLDAHNGS